jgi:hypothetical protein
MLEPAVLILKSPQPPCLVESDNLGKILSYVSPVFEFFSECDLSMVNYRPQNIPFEELSYFLNNITNCMLLS